MNIEEAFAAIAKEKTVFIDVVWYSDFEWR